jgi:predicted DNA-binding helix-hairpin-helix protein
VREHRLYQADWLIRFYGFKVDEIAASGNLDLAVDPKLSWALGHCHLFPIDLNKASRELLLRAPGLGQKSVERILRMRRWHKLRCQDLARLRLPVSKVLPFVIVADHRPSALALDSDNLAGVFRRPGQQLDLFPVEQSVLSGEL